jgi:hypothetical protein
MFTPLLSALVSIRSWFRTRAALQLENLALRHQQIVLKRSQRGRLRLDSADRLLWVWLSRLWSNWRLALFLVKPETVIAWQRRGFRAKTVTEWNVGCEIRLIAASGKPERDLEAAAKPRFDLS